MPLSRTVCLNECPQARNHWSKISLSQLERKFVFRIIAAFNHPICFPALRASSFKAKVSERNGARVALGDHRENREASEATRTAIRKAIRTAARKHRSNQVPLQAIISQGRGWEARSRWWTTCRSGLFFSPTTGFTLTLTAGKVPPPLWRTNSLGTAFTLCGHHLFAEHPRQ
jgi:hypothetical protein